MTKKEIRECSRKLQKEIVFIVGLGKCPITLDDLDILVQVVYKMLPQKRLFDTRLYKQYKGVYSRLIATSVTIRSLKQMFMSENVGRLVCITTTIENYKYSGNKWVSLGSETMFKSLKEVRRLEGIYKNRANSENFTGVRIKYTTGSKIRSQYVPDNLTLPSKLSSVSTKGGLTDTYITFNYETARVF